MLNTEQNVQLIKKELGQFRDDDSIVELADETGYWMPKVEVSG